MKKLSLSLLLIILAVSACDNNVPPTKAPAAENPHAAGNPVADKTGK